MPSSVAAIPGSAPSTHDGSIDSRLLHETHGVARVPNAII
jgi:hypothetical protein